MLTQLGHKDFTVDGAVVLVARAPDAMSQLMAVTTKFDVSTANRATTAGVFRNRHEVVTRHQLCLVADRTFF